MLGSGYVEMPASRKKVLSVWFASDFRTFSGISSASLDVLQNTYPGLPWRNLKTYIHTGPLWRQTWQRKISPNQTPPKYPTQHLRLHSWDSWIYLQFLIETNFQYIFRTSLRSIISCKINIQNAWVSASCMLFAHAYKWEFSGKVGLDIPIIILTSKQAKKYQRNAKQMVKNYEIYVK